MASKFSSRSDFDIPDSLLDEHEWMVDELIDSSIGKILTLHYPTTKEECPNCIYDWENQRSSNIYKSGGPASFTNYTQCPWCYGVGLLSKEETDTIRARMYWTPQEWKKILGTNFVAPDGSVLLIAYMDDRSKFQRAQFFVYKAGQEEWRFSKGGDEIPWGFRKNRYFAQLLKRS